MGVRRTTDATPGASDDVLPSNRSRMTTEGLGDTKPIASNDQEETRMKNRRVEFTITKK